MVASERNVGNSLLEIEKVVVIGSGVMGAGIAAHMANSGYQVALLDIVPTVLSAEDESKGWNEQSPEFRSSLARKAIANMAKQKPAPLYDPALSANISGGNIEDHQQLIADGDWIIEVIVERLDAKQQLYSLIDSVRRKGTLVSSNTSGLSASEMVAHCSKDLREHFAVTHFFNPPRYMNLVEVVATEDTLPEVTNYFVKLCEQKLGKGVVLAKDTPNFIANRIGTYGMLVTLFFTEHYQLTIDEADALTGVAMGRPKTATFRMLDLVGLDTLLHVVDNVASRSSDPLEQEIFKRPAILEELVIRGALGQKSGAGFYRKTVNSSGKSMIESLDLANQSYRVALPIQSPVIDAAKQGKGAAGKVKALLYTHPEHKHAQFAWETLKKTLLYAAEKLDEIASSIVDIDKAMKLGFNWELGPFELWDVIGLPQSVQRMRDEGEQIPEWIEQWLADGHTHFYEKREGKTWYVSKRQFVELEQDPSIISLAQCKEQKGTVWSNSGASLIDIGDDVLALEFHSKSNAIGNEILSAIRYAAHEVDRNWRGLVIANEGKNFCVGANLMLLLMEAQNEEWEEVEDIIAYFQQSMLQLKKLNRPVVAAPHRMTLGGGVEACLPADIIVASPETYFGLVETGVGLIPAGGGCKEAAILAMQRAAQGAAASKKLLAGDIQPYLNQLFETIALAKTSTSGHDIVNLGFARDGDRVISRGEARISEAKKAVLHLDELGYRAPKEELIAVAGREGKAVLQLGIQAMKLSGYITDHDELIANKLAHVLSGGNVPSGAKVSQQYLLELEKEAFLSLCGELKTQERMSHMLTRGKPLRN